MIGDPIPRAGALRIWWIPQIPMDAFTVAVPDLATASLLLDTLARYDAFQFENNIKPDYCNMGGLMEFEAGVADWFEWEHPETGDSFDEVRRDRELLTSAIEAASAGETGEAQLDPKDESAVRESGDAQTPESKS